MATFKRNGYYKSQMFVIGKDMIRKMGMVVVRGVAL